MDKKYSKKDIDLIVKNTIEAINSSRDQVLNIVEAARTEYESFKQELEALKTKVELVILEVDALEVQDKILRQKLVQVSKNFKDFGEKDIKEVYEKASETRIKYSIKQNEEKVLRERRNQLEISLRNSYEIMKNAEKIINQVTIAMNYLKGEIMSVIGNIDDSSEHNMLLGIKILEAQENERKRISRDIHDGPAQSMANIVMKADICERIIIKNLDEGLVELKELKASVANTLKEVRNIIFDLRPMSLDDIGLNPTIERLVSSYSTKSTIKYDLVLQSPKSDIDSIIMIAVYRLLQEMLNNVKKHSNATKVAIKIEYGTKYLRMIVADDGVGFPYEETLENLKLKGESYGLLGMHERIGQLNGKIVVSSKKNSGTVYNVKLPVSKEVMLDEQNGD